MPVTIKDIAKEVGFSINTVSRALNNKPDVSKKTRELILKTAKRLNYTPNGIARSLVKKKTNTLGVLIPDISESYFAEILHSIEQVSRNNNYDILLINTDWDPAIEDKSIKILFEKRVAGILICPTEKNNRYLGLLKTSKIPFVLFNCSCDSLKCNYVVNDNVYGAYLAVNYLIKKGYEEFYFIYTLAHNSTCRDRIVGCKRALRKNDIPLKTLKLVNCERNPDAFYKITRNKINYNGKKIGIFAWDDEMAAVVCRSIIDKGLRIPEDVGIVGYDDIDISKYSIIPLTTIWNPATEIGTKSAEILIKKIKSEYSSKVERVILKPKLVVRESA